MRTSTQNGEPPPDTGASAASPERDIGDGRPVSQRVDDPAVVRRILTSYRVWAVVGASPDPSRASFGVIRFLRRHGYRVIPVNPLVDEVDGLPCYPDLASIPQHEGVEVVDVFRRSEHVAGVVDEAIAIGAKAVWCQLGVIDLAAHRTALAAGLDVVMDVCPAIEHPRLVGAGNRV